MNVKLKFSAGTKKNLPEELIYSISGKFFIYLKNNPESILPDILPLQKLYQMTQAQLRLVHTFLFQLEV